MQKQHAMQQPVITSTKNNQTKKRERSQSPSIVRKPIKKRPLIKCLPCGEYFFESEVKYRNHLKTLKHLNNCCKQLEEEEGIFLVETAFKNRINTFRINAMGPTDIPTFLSKIAEKVCALIRTRLNITSIKLGLELFAEYKKFLKEDDDHLTTDVKSFQVKHQAVTNSSNLEEIYREMCEKIQQKSEEFQVRFIFLLIR
jgi:hypothetical protein